MGTVWRAADERLCRDVAVKEMTRLAWLSAADPQAARRRASREAAVAAGLSHRNVIQVFDVLEEDGWPWIVMELLPPWTLHDLIRRQGRLNPAQAAAVGLEILAALRAAHARGIVHQDVKPANILLAPGRVVLTDFGIARVAGAPALALADELIGSPSYIAPERALGGQAGPPADLWGLGASLYAAVEGRGPFDRGGDVQASLAAAVADDPAPAVHAGPLLWPVISGLLGKDPATRLDAAAAGERLRRAAVPAVALAVTSFPRPRLPLAPAAARS